MVIRAYRVEVVEGMIKDDWRRYRSLKEKWRTGLTLYVKLELDLVGEGDQRW